MTTALVLAGHGSHISPQTAGIVWEHVDALRALGVADEVTAAFWKEPPSYHWVLNTLTATDITIVPLFTAQGYFTQTVIPTELGLSGALTERNGITIRYARTLNEHPYLGQVVRQRVQDALTTLGSTAAQTAVAILGHSTRRNPESRRATEAQAALMREANLASEVVAAYLDDSPGIDEVYAMTSAPTLIAVPYFLASGSHTTIDVPRALQLEPGQTQAHINGRAVYYTEPVGTEESLRDVILELAREAGAPLHAPRVGSAWDCFPNAGRDTLSSVVEAAGTLQFGELSLTLSEVRPITGEPLETITEPDGLRRIVRETPFRPLPTAVGLPGGWRVPVENTAQLFAVVETVYPGAVADWAAHQHGTFAPETFDSTIERQTGMFRQLADMPLPTRDTLVARVCSACVRHATWHHGGSPDHAIPCAEPCNVWLSEALEQLD